MQEPGAEDEAEHSLVHEQAAESGNEKIDEIKRAAAEDVAAIEEGDTYSARSGSEEHSLVRRQAAESGDERIDEIKRAAAEAVAAIEEGGN